MGMSTSVVGVRDLDGHFDKMMKLKLACEAAGVRYLAEVEAYFTDDHYGYGASGTPEQLRRALQQIDIKGAVKTIDDIENTDCWEVDLSQLPAEVKSIRFMQSW